MNKKPQKVTLCSNTECWKKDCPNYTPKYVKGSYSFPDCYIRTEKNNAAR